MEHIFAAKIVLLERAIAKLENRPDYKPIRQRQPADYTPVYPDDDQYFK